MDIRDALYHTVRAYPGGARALAPRLGKSGTTLCHEVAPPEGSSAKAGLLDVVAIMELTRNHAVFHAMAAHLGYVAVPMPELHEAHEDTGVQVAVLAKEFGDVMVEIAQGAADAEINDNELRALRRQWSELVSAGNVLLATWAAKNAQGKRKAASGCRGSPRKRSAAPVSKALGGQRERAEA
jgi:hypothetical protein